MESQDIHWLRKNVCHPHKIYSGKQVKATIKIIERHYQQKHRIFDELAIESETDEEKENEEKAIEDNHNIKMRLTGGTLDDGTKWGDCIYIEKGKCSGCNVDTMHTCQHVGCRAYICNKCYEWCEDIADLRCWYHLSQEKQQTLSQQSIQHEVPDDDNDVGTIADDEIQSQDITDIEMLHLIGSQDNGHVGIIDHPDDGDVDMMDSQVNRDVDRMQSQDNRDVEMIDSNDDNLSDDDIIAQMDTPGFEPNDDESDEDYLEILNNVNVHPTQRRRSQRIQNKPRPTYVGLCPSSDNNKASSAQDYLPQDENEEQVDDIAIVISGPPPLEDINDESQDNVSDNHNHNRRSRRLRKKNTKPFYVESGSSEWAGQDFEPTPITQQQAAAFKNDVSTCSQTE